MLSPTDHDPANTTATIPPTTPKPSTKRPRLDTDLLKSSMYSKGPASTEKRTNSWPPLKDWPDDIIIHLLQFLDYDSLINFHTTCKRTHFFIQRNLKHLLEPFICAIPTSNDIDHLLSARSHFIPHPPRHSFAYFKLLKQYHSSFELISATANPVQHCPRSKIHPDIDFTYFLPSHIDFFRTSYCYYFSNPLPHVAHFWTIFWEYKRQKALDPMNYAEVVAEWAWKRYTYREILGVARFNGSYYSRIITSSLNCQRDALRMVLEIYSTRDTTSEIWSVNNGPSSLQSRSLSNESKSEYRTGQIPPGIERFSVTIPITVSVSAKITPHESTSTHTFSSLLSGLDLALSQLADFGSVYNAKIDKDWEARNMVKTVEFQDFFDFVWGGRMAERAAEEMGRVMNEFLDGLG